MFKQYFRDRFREIFGKPLEPSDGLGDDAVLTEMERGGINLPIALGDYYAVAGRHWINENHNRLRPIAELERVADQLVFMEENQCVVFWGIRTEDLGEADPVVWLGVNGELIEWYSEQRRLSRFLMAMWKWTMTGVEEPPESI